MKTGMYAALAVAGVLSAPEARAQSAVIDAFGVSHATIVSDQRVGVGVGIDNPLYFRTPGAGGPARQLCEPAL